MPFVLAVIGSFIVALFFALAANCLGLYSLRKMENAHWTERARRLYPIYRSAGMNVWLIAALCGVAEWQFFPTQRNSWGIALMAVVGWVGAYLGMYPLAKKAFPQFSFATWLKHVLAIRLLGFGVLGILFLAGIVMPDEFGWETIVLACVVFGFQIALYYGLWFWMGLKLGIYEHVKDSEKVIEIVRQTSERMKISYRKIWKLKSPAGYAAAMPILRDLIFSEGMLKTTPDEEVAAICAHELAHLDEPRKIHRARLVTSLGFFPFIFLRPTLHLFGPMGLVFLWLPGGFLGVYARRLGRKMEVRADSAASENPDSAGVYARALERLYRNNQMPAVMPGERRIHPHLYDRLLAAGVTPDYPRPKAPETLSWISGFMIFVLAISLVAILCQEVVVQPLFR